jgi:hypothetical protein
MKNVNMKNVLLAILVSAYSLGACTSSDSGKEKKTTVSDSSATEKIGSYAAIDSQVASIRKSIPTLPYVRSLRYQKGDYSFDVSVYLKGSNPVSMFEDGNTGEYGYKQRSVYFIDDKPSFVFTAEKKINGKDFIYKETKSYLADGELVISLSRSAAESSELLNKPFKAENDTTNYVEVLKKMNRALDKSGEFDLPFNRITKLEDKSYLVLGKGQGQGYQSSLLILPDRNDEIIKKILTNPKEFEGKKLDVKWEYQNLKGNEQLIYNGVNAKN